MSRHLSPSAEDLALLEKFGHCSPFDLAHSATSLAVSTSDARWLNAVAERLIVGDYVSLAHAPKAELSAILHRDDDDSMSVALQLAHVDAVLDAFGSMSSDELRAHAHQPSVHASLSADLLRWADKLEWRGVANLLATPSYARQSMVL